MRTNLSSQFDAATIRATKARIVERNTFERFEDGARIIRLHATDVVSFKRGGRITLNSGGYRTMTTRGRINAYLPSRYAVHTHRGMWTVHDRESGASVPYYDGMTLPNAFKARRKADANAKREATLQKQIADFVKLIPIDGSPRIVPSAGDCFVCACERPHGNKYHGYPTSGSRGDGGDHLLQHIREGYMHGTLIWNAVQWSGYKPEYMAGGKIARQCVRRYLQAKLGLVSR
jgi:hypothetical protein